MPKFRTLNPIPEGALQKGAPTRTAPGRSQDISADATYLELGGDELAGKLDEERLLGLGGLAHDLGAGLPRAVQVGQALEFKQELAGEQKLGHLLGEELNLARGCRTQMPVNGLNIMRVHRPGK